MSSLECCSRDTAPVIPLDQMDCEDAASQEVFTEPEDSALNLSVESSESGSSGIY